MTRPTTPPPGPAAAPPPGAPGDLDRRRERELLRAAAAGDRQAAGWLIEATYESVYRTLVRSGGDPELAADLTQETYRKAWTSLPSFRGDARFGTWLHRIATTTWLNHLRRPRRLAPLSDEVTRTADDPSPGPEARATAGAEAERLRRAVSRLPDDLAWTVAAHYWGELPVREIARQEGVTGAAIRKRLDKARRLLAEEMGTTATPGAGPGAGEGTR